MRHIYMDDEPEKDARLPKEIGIENVHTQKPEQKRKRCFRHDTKMHEKERDITRPGCLSSSFSPQVQAGMGALLYEKQELFVGISHTHAHTLSCPNALPPSPFCSSLHLILNLCACERENETE